MNTRKMLQLGMLSAVGIALHLAESMIPVPLPGVKLGLANGAALFTLATFGLREAAYVSLIRIVIGSLLGGSLFGPSFVMSVSGALSSLLIMGYAHYAWQPFFSLIGVSVLGAAVHSTVQVLTAAALLSAVNLLWYLPYVLLPAVLAGMIIGLATLYAVRYTPVFVRK